MRREIFFREISCNICGSCDPWVLCVCFTCDKEWWCRLTRSGRWCDTCIRREFETVRLLLVTGHEAPGSSRLFDSRAAIDFLLLAQGHGCEEFEGMCCMNLSDHSQSIHKQLSILRDNMKKLRETSDPFTDWLSSLGLSGWWVTVLEKMAVIIIVILLLILLLPCVLQCLQKLITNSVKRVLMVQQEGGNDGNDLFNPERTSSETQLIEGGLWELMKNGPQESMPNALRHGDA